ncbi:hypothetical protein [Nonomuraea endophytica]|uniref:Uncharacterized protein n=1 Tax=Nonomuraea endophytica TaxID=714136 RepID=A0A7W8EEH5_9ACTN|nr:hypothetical protein [Nonomuraea endophytica]MBB5076418.1 hypothetical protein [Nonomuraea endophytica]
MLAVLLQTAAPGQRRPGLSDALDLIRGGLLVRVNHTVGAPSAPHWRRAVNLAALLGPLALFTLGMADTAGFAVRWLHDARSGMHFLNSPGRLVMQLLAFALPYLLIGVLAWRGRRKLAAGCAWAWVFVHAYLVTAVPPDLDLAPHHVTLGAGMAYLGGLASIESANIIVAVLVTFAADPKAASLTFGKALTWMTAGFATLFAGEFLVLVISGVGGPVAYVLLLLAVSLPVATVAMNSATGRRVAFILLLLLVLVFPGNLVRPAMALTAMALAIITSLAIRVCAQERRPGSS